MVRLVGLNEYADLPREDVAWIIEDLIPQPGIVLLVGDPKQGKSFLALQIALAIAQGAKQFMGKKVRQGTVLYVMFESEFAWRKRMLELRQAAISLDGPLYMVHPEDQPPRVNILTSTSYVFLRDAIAKSNPNLVILDVLRELHSGDENDALQMKVVGDALSTLCHGRGLLLLHHPRKSMDGAPRTSNPVQAARGSSYLTGKVESIWLMHEGYLHIESRLTGKQRIRMIQGPNGLWAFPNVIT